MDEQQHAQDKLAAEHGLRPIDPDFKPGLTCTWFFASYGKVTQNKRVKVMTEPIGPSNTRRGRVRIDHVNKEGVTVKEGGYVNIEELYQQNLTV